MDKRLSISWDKNDKLAIHLNHQKIRNLSPGFIQSLVSDIESHEKTLRAHGLNNPIVIESWLLAPELSRHNTELKNFQKTINLRLLRAISPSLRLRHIAWMMKHCIDHRKKARKKSWGAAKRTRSNSPKTLTTLRIFIALQKVIVMTLALLWLIPSSIFICYRLHKLPAPEFKNSYILKNGEPGIKLTIDAETALNKSQPMRTFSSLPLKRMSTFSVIVLVTYTPRIAIKLGGWVGGVSLVEH
ncbi:hypothetical protein HX882_26805 [Pseudomonas gingeri]|uniref:Uncharacterized protein n=1 Tax=Pseudomonas gingeri TaxID=117681 RepID=A0A7Y7XGZ5_9PSED|nr:hypothetical protein [Pseudomonas gingeri]NWB99506.1 hypothetical protein [Pseudomonas gingeri]